MRQLKLATLGFFAQFYIINFDIFRLVVNVAIVLACFALVCTQMIFVAEMWKQVIQIKVKYVFTG